MNGIPDEEVKSTTTAAAGTTEKQRKMTIVQPTVETFIFPLHGSSALLHPTTGLASGQLAQAALNNYQKNSILKQIRDKHYPQPSIPVPLEFSIHQCPPSFKSELKFVFPDLNVGSSISSKSLYIIPVFQHTNLDILGTGEMVELEKSRCLENFYLFGLSLAYAIRERGYWADLTDPASGLPMLGERGTSYYPDVYGCQRLLGYEVVNCGCCNVLNHPRFGARVYPATIFADCDLEVLKSLLLISTHNNCC